MIVKKIQYIENKSLFEVSFENEKMYISYEYYSERNIKKDYHLSIEEYENLRDESDYQTLKKRIESFMSYKTRTTYEVKNKLYTYSSNTRAIDRVISYYKNLGFLDDRRYAENYIEYCINVKKYSKKKTLSKLCEKGIRLNLIDPIFENNDFDSEYQNATHIFSKKFNCEQLKDFKSREKVIRHLLYKAFDYDVIKKVLSKCS